MSGAWYSVADGNWSAGTTWDRGVKPTSIGLVYITNTVTYDMLSKDVTCSTITISNTGILQFEQGVSTRVLIVEGNIDIQNTGKLLMEPNTGYVSILKIKCAVGGQYGIIVNNGGVFDVRGSSMAFWRTTLNQQADSGQNQIVTDDVTALEDISKWVKIIVQPAIQYNNIVTNPDTICFNGDPQLIVQGTNDLVVPTTKYLYYLWQTSTNHGINWSVPDTLGKEYDPPAGLLDPTWYRRVVISGRCIDFGGVDSIEVLPLLADNLISVSSDTICFGGDTDLATEAGPTGGLPSDYRYQWEYSITGLDGSWNPVAGETSAAYDPDASVSLAVGNHYYRRKVFSGEMDACRDSSNSVLRKVWPVLSGNTIAADQTIGYDSIPDLLTETATIGGGDGSGY